MSAVATILAGIILAAAPVTAGGPPWPVVDTGQIRCHADGYEIPYPKSSDPWFGQDAQYEGDAPKYRNNRDGTVTDLVTGLIWQKTPDFVKRTSADAKKYAAGLKLGGRRDWRLPNVKELQTIVDYGRAPDATDRHFDRLDKNSDGYLDADEAPTGPPRRRPSRRPGR